jgi:hypothetical protein
LSLRHGSGRQARQQRGVIGRPALLPEPPSATPLQCALRRARAP